MRRGSMTRRLGVTGAALVSVVLAGCSFGTPTLAKENVEMTVSDRLAEEVGQAPDKVECPGDLTGKVGTTMRCTLTFQGDTIGLTVTVTGVDGTTVKFDIAVDENLTEGS